MSSEPQYDVHVSYARSDNKDGHISVMVKMLEEEYKELSSRKLNVFLDVDEIPPADPWKERILASLSGNPAMLAFVSPAYFDSEWCMKEWEHYRNAQPDELQLIAPVLIEDVPGFPKGKMTRTNPWSKSLAGWQVTDLRGAGVAPRVLKDRLAPLARQLAKRQRATPSSKEESLPQLVAPLELRGSRLDVTVIHQAAQRLLDIVNSGRGAFNPDLVLGVNESGVAAAAIMAREFKKPLGIISTKREEQQGDQRRVIDYVSLPERIRYQEPGKPKVKTENRKGQNILIVDGKFKSGESAAQIESIIGQIYPGANTRHGIVLTYGDWEANWQAAFPSVPWPVRHKTRRVLAYVAFNKLVQGIGDPILEVLRDGEKQRTS
jgi:adenine/guanine phosphoribosyltransferase-like PRPP-binding protein